MSSLFRVLNLFCLLAVLPAAACAAPAISEFMASNKTTLVDDDGDTSDWIELHNPAEQPVNLEGWYLTDRASAKTKWRFPAVTIPAQGYLIVFASGKDRANPAAALHTNFSLSADGEYLALVEPDGKTVAFDFAPAFPPQTTDISYGTGSAGGGSVVGFLQAPTPGTANAPAILPAPASVQLAQPDGTSATFSSAQPILVLDNQGLGAMEQATGEVTGTVQLIESDTLSARFDAGLKVRGSTSADFPKKSYSIELHDETGDNRRVSLLGMAANADWALVSPWLYDPSYLRSAFVYALSNRIGRWAPRTRFTEVFFNPDGGALSSDHYAGVSVLTERIKIASDLVNIRELSANDTDGDAVTGGYILKFDPKDADEVGWVTDRGIPADSGVGAGTMLVIVSPTAAKLAPEQQDYIQGYVQAFENALFADREANWATRDYAGYIDVPSWIDFHLLQVLAKNPDGLARSAYFHKDRGGRLKAGPVWDFDRAMGSVDPRSVRWDEWSEPTQASQLWETGWWGVLASDPEFIQAWVDRWQMLRRDSLSSGNLIALVNNLGAQLDPAAAARDAARWPDNASRFEDGHAGEVKHLAVWLTSRAEWIDGQLVAAPATVVTVGARELRAPEGAYVVYTLDGSDPRAPGGGIAVNAVVAASSLVLPEGVKVAARSYDPSHDAGKPASSAWSSAVTVNP